MYGYARKDIEETKEKEKETGYGWRKDYWGKA